MNDPAPPPRIPTWITATVLTLLAAQTTLVWIQGGLIHRQHLDLEEMRDDIQFLSDSLDQSQNQIPDTGEDLAIQPARQTAHNPGRHPLHRPRRHRPALQRVRMLQEAQPASSEDDKARKDLEAAQKSAQSAVQEARETQSKLSIEENIRRAEEKKRMEGATGTWQKWVWIALGAGILAMAARGWMKRRG